MAATGSSSSTIKLYTHAMCPFAQKAWLALNFANAPFEMEQIDLYGGKPSWFLELNPKGLVPVLKASEKVITESEDILSFIGSDQFAEYAGNNMLQQPDRPSDVIYWRDAIDSKLKVVGKKAVLSMSGLGNGSELGKVLEELEAKYSLTCSHEATFLAGGNPSIADCAAFPFLYRLSQHFKDGQDLYPHLMGNWLQLMESREEVKSTIQKSWWWWW